MEDEVMKELHEIRANIVSEHSHDKQKLDAFFESLRFPGFTYGIPGRTFQTEEELDQYIEERNRDFERRKAQAATENSPYQQPLVTRTENFALQGSNTLTISLKVPIQTPHSGTRSPRMI